MKKVLSFIFAVIIAAGSFMIAAGAADVSEHGALYWPGNFYDYAHKAPDPSPWLGELKIGENSVLSLIKGHYTFTAPETGYYSFGSWFEESLKIEGDKVTEINYVGTHGPFSGMTYIEKGTEHCFRFFNNSWEEEIPDPGDITIRFLGKIVSVRTAGNDYAYTRDLSYYEEYSESPYTVSNLDVDITFADNTVISDNWWSGKLDSAEPGRRRLTIPEFLGGPGFDIEFTLLGCNDFIEEIKPCGGCMQADGDFYSAAEISYNDSAERKGNGKLFSFRKVNTPEEIITTLKDGTVIKTESKYFRYDCFDGIADEIEGCAWFTVSDGSQHNVTSAYKENEDGKIIFIVRIDTVETVIEEEPVCRAVLGRDFRTFFNDLKDAWSEADRVSEKFEAAKSEIQTFVKYCKYVFSNGYFANTGDFNKV